MVSGVPDVNTDAVLADQTVDIRTAVLIVLVALQ